MSKDKKKKKKPLKPKVNIEASMPPPKPIQWNKPSASLEHAREYPILGCWVMAGWRESGLTPVIVARQQPSEKVIFASVLVDLLLLGAKDSYYYADVSLNRFQKDLPRICMGEPEACDAGLAHEIIYGAIEFAKKFGFEPHPDFKLASLVLDPPGAHPIKNQVEFGKDGKPFFLPGPDDNVPLILSKLRKTAGEGNFGGLLNIGGEFS